MKLTRGMNRDLEIQIIQKKVFTQSFICFLFLKFCSKIKNKFCRLNIRHLFFLFFIHLVRSYFSKS